MTVRLNPRQLVEKLVSFPTVSRDGNIGLITWVADYLASHGVASTQVPDAQNPEKAALYAHVGPMVEGGVVLSGHTDVVPVDGQDWGTDPFKVTEIDGKLYGRGTADMKGFDALAIWAMVEAHHLGITRPLQLALSYDEEIGCTGAPPMIDAMVNDAGLPRAELVIVGEPSELKAVTGHKGGLGFVVDVKGFEVHSSLMHTGVNAIMEGAKLINWANARNADSMAATPAPMAAVFDPPWTTVHTGTISGGTAHNITAADCRFGLDFRFVPGDDSADWVATLNTEVARLEAAMKAIRPEAGITMTERFSVPPLTPEENGPAEALVRQLTGDNGTHVVSYATEAGQFQERGYSAVVCGPGNIEQAHQPDEFITIEQFEAGQAFLSRLLDTLKE
ncbi:acetylornithine deacetylase [Actibacterium mucosum KCTC 23349]|uniref:Acetylornithine deacetylase n=1 Tax=Actibacterium mucosum KCTC 23349 TaxID=1454373 RepID=A0A037ZHH5_9RHOB|nr:acetylornithine deacetylase [Actibacterium mucosum]KAJ55588.1 acetylornithine deacetylase [Actibacterium mucosum KCTC 23349]